MTSVASPNRVSGRVAIRRRAHIMQHIFQRVILRLAEKLTAFYSDDLYFPSIRAAFHTIYWTACPRQIGTTHKP